MSRLRIPLEPKPLKECAQNEGKKLEKQGRDMKAIMVVLWSDSPYRKLFSLLWNEWKSPLKEQGMRHQDFQKVISKCKFDLYDWVKEKLSWEELILKIQEKIETSFGERKWR